MVTDVGMTTILDNLMEGVYIVSPDWRLLYVNKTMVSYMNYPREEVLGRTILEVYPGFEKTEIFKAYKRSMEQRVVTQSEIEFEFPGHSRGWFEIRTQPVEQGILVLAIDVSERKKVNEDILSRERMLTESQKVAHIGSWEWDIADDEVTWSDELHRIFGLMPTDFGATYESFLKYAHPEDRQVVSNSVQQALDDHKDFEHYYRVVRPDGIERIVHGKGNVVVENGVPVKMRGIAQDVTDRRMVEEKIAKNEQLLAESQRIAHIGSWEWDIAANQVTWSDEQYRIFGLNRLGFDATLESFFKCVHPEDRAFMENTIQQAIHNHKDFDVHYKVLRPNGIVRLVHGRGTVVLKNGKPVKLQGVTQDVTERSIVEQAIKQNEQLLSESQKVAHVGSWDFNMTESKLTWSDEMYRIYGLDPQVHQITYEDYLKYNHPEDLELVTNTIRQALEDHKDFDFNHRIIRQDGTVRILQGRGKVILENGVPVRMLGVGQDVTERKTAEEEIIKQKKFTEAVLNNIPGDVAVFDKDQNYVFINPRAVSSPELRQWLIGKNDFDYCQHKGLDDTLAQKRKKRFGEAVQSKADVEWIDEQQDNQGRLVYMLRKFHPVFEDNQLAYVIGYGVNITDLKTTEKKLGEALQSAQSAFKDLEQFSYMVSHDLQEPLRMVSSFLNLLKQKASDQLDDLAKQYVYYAVDGADRMKILIQDLLQFSKISTGAEDFKEVDVNEVLQYVIHVQQFEIKKNDAQVTCTQLPVITANHSLVSQLFMNLISNSIKYNNKANPQVEVGSTEDAVKWTFYVKDNGIGIAPENLEKVFLIFKRLHTRQEYSGTGIGLAICNKIVEKHGGSIWVESEPGKGSTFYFTIPKKIAS